jgi:DNA mismatch repair protein MutS2
MRRVERNPGNYCCYFTPMDRHTIETLEMDALLALLARHVQTPLGRTLISKLKPTADRMALERALDLTSECVQLLDSGQGFGLAGVEDPEPSFVLLQVEGTMLDPRHVLDLERLVSVGLGLRDFLRGADTRHQWPGLAAIGGRIPDLRGLLSSIRGKVLPGGEIDDNASPELRSIRREILASRGRIHRALDEILRQQARAVQDEIITFRNGRFVIPIRTDSRIQVPGVVHGLSSSGQTSYVEPLGLIDQNNLHVRLQEQEEIEKSRILLAISDSFRAERHSLRIIADRLAEIDLCQAKARLALEFGCVRPQLSRSRVFRLQDAVHILLEHSLRQTGNHAVPISFELDETRQILVISGPNAGGKTVVLKTSGLIALMAQMGLHVPAREAVLPVFDQVFADIGDQQSIAANLSTFTAHMRNIAEMAGKVSPPALLLLDEVGTGTDPEEGAALGIAILDHFRRAGVMTLASTHYHALKIWASQTPGVLNASVEFDERTLQPTYRLMVGLAGASSGLEIARRMKVPAEILNRARSLTDPGHLVSTEFLKKLKTMIEEQEAARKALEEEREATAQKYERLEKDFAEREAGRHAEFRAAMESLGREFSERSETMLAELRDRITAEKMKKAVQIQAGRLRRAGSETAKRIETQLNLAQGAHTGISTGPGSAPAAPILAEPKPGDRVWVRPLSQAGIVDSAHEDTYTINVGSLKFRACREEIQLLETASSLQSARPKPQPAPELSLTQQFSPEINVIGCTADEAVDRVDKFLDEAFLAGAETVRIIHGHGKGILRRAVAQHLGNHPQVEKFNPANPNQGGGGVTVVELKK